MNNLYTGSNFGYISSNNSFTNPTTTGSYEIIQNYSSGSVFLNFSGGLGTLTIYYSQDSSGTNPITEVYNNINESRIISFTPQGAYLKIGFSGPPTYSVQTKYFNTSTIIPLDGIHSVNNSTSTNLNNGSNFTGTWEDVSNYSLITILSYALSAASTTTATINCQFSNNGSTITRTILYDVQDASATQTTDTTSTTFNPVHTLVPVDQYFRVIFTNTSGSNFTTTSLNIIYHKNKSKSITSRTSQYLTDYFDVDNTRAIVNARTEGTTLPGGNYQNIQCNNGSLNVRLREPTSAFGELLSASLTPFVQIDATSGRPLDVIATYQNDYGYTGQFIGTVGQTGTYYNFEDSKAGIYIPTNCINNAKIELNSTIYTKYKAGQGMDNRFTALFPSSGITGSDQYAGIFTVEDSACFGYFDGLTGAFGIQYKRFGKQQINRIAITNNATSSGTITFNFGGTTVSISVTSGDTPLNIAYKLYLQLKSSFIATYGFDTDYYNLNNITTTYYLDCVYLKAQTSSVTISVTSGTLGTSISISTIRSGLDPSISYYKQSEWNIDTCMDMGSLQKNYIFNPSGFRLDPTKGNVYKIFFQYLGFGSIHFSIEVTESSVIIPVHVIKYSNLFVNPSFRSPNMKIGIGAEVLGLTLPSSELQVKTTSFASFLQGIFKPTDIYRSYSYYIRNNTTAGFNSLSRNNPGVLFGIKALNIYESLNSNNTINYVVNKSNIFLFNISLSVNAASSINSNIIFMLIKNPTEVNKRTGTGTTTVPYIDFEKENNSLIEIMNGVTVSTSGGGDVNKTGIILTGGSIVSEFSLSDSTNLIQDISSYNIILSPLESYYIAFYGYSSGNVDLTASLSFYVNM